MPKLYDLDEDLRPFEPPVIHLEPEFENWEDVPMGNVIPMRDEPDADPD